MDTPMSMRPSLTYHIGPVRGECLLACLPDQRDGVVGARRGYRVRQEAARPARRRQVERHRQARGLGRQQRDGHWVRQRQQVEQEQGHIGQEAQRDPGHTEKGGQ